MPFKTLLFFCIVFSFSCKNTPQHISKLGNPQPAANISSDKNPYRNIKTIPLPEGYTRVNADSGSFAGWLRNAGLKESKTVYLYNGTPKANQRAQFAVLDIPVGNKNLQQCADAVMRLEAEYLFAAKKYQEISFTDNENGVYNFTPPYTREHFSSFMERVFGMCGSASLSKQLRTVPDFAAIEPGDVLIRGGFPGHAAIVMDVAENKAGNKVYLLAQSYMPAQDIHVLVNPMDESLSPWYKVSDSKQVYTPEYLFYTNELKQW
ncbi:DUF4846 domain-containing protein [Ferruginibacter sp.]